MAQSTPLQFIVPDMDCEGCVSSITNAVQKLDADASVTADLESKQVVIGSTVEAHEIATAIEGAGFTVKST